MDAAAERIAPLARRAVAPFVAGFLVMVCVGLGLSLAAGDGAVLADPDAEPDTGFDDTVQSVTASEGSAPSFDHLVEIEDWTSTYVTADGVNIAVYDGPGGDVVRTLRSADVLTVPGATPLVMLVAADDATGGADPEWFEVYLPVRPNGTTGWVRAEAVTVGTTEFWIEVSLSQFEMIVHRGSDVVLRTAIGVGRDDRPTPGGVYYLKELLKVPNAGGAYGPYAYGLSGYQSTLDSFNGGQAVIGIHGTNDPTSFGRVVSSGCIRVPNATITRLAEEIGPPLGTPVSIVE